MMTFHSSFDTHKFKSEDQTKQNCYILYTPKKTFKK
jgi:predicted peptidase